MKEIFCEHPQFIINPQFRIDVFKNDNYYLNNKRFDIVPSRWLFSFPYSYFSPKRLKVGFTNADNYFTVSPDGTCTPMFIAVPCGKCCLCRDKKARDWTFRAHCESSTSSTCPLFLTLTYDEVHKPVDGLCKRDVQLFLKRLRMNLSRAGHDVSDKLRYFICGEYGSKTHRPHYHVLLWNFPVLSTRFAILEVISSTWQNGFVYGGPVENGAASYCMKYMRKESFIPTYKKYFDATPFIGESCSLRDGSLCDPVPSRAAGFYDIPCNPTFFLASRRNGGIGAAVCYKYKQFFRENPDTEKLTVFDPWSNVSKTASLPDYFLRKIFPTRSILFKRSAVHFRAALYNIASINSLSQELRDLRFDLSIDLGAEFDELRHFSKFFSLPFNPSCISNRHILSLAYKYPDNSSRINIYMQELCSQYASLQDSLEYLRSHITLCFSEFHSLMLSKERRLEHLSLVHCEDKLYLDDAVRRSVKNYNSSLVRETF